MKSTSEWALVIFARVCTPSQFERGRLSRDHSATCRYLMKAPNTSAVIRYLLKAPNTSAAIKGVYAMLRYLSMLHGVSLPFFLLSAQATL